MAKPKIITRFVMLAIIAGFLSSNFLLINIYQIIILLGALLAFCIIPIIFKKDLRILVFSLIGIFFVLSYIFANQVISHYRPTKDFIQLSEISGLINEKPVLDDKQKVVLLVRNQNRDIKVLVNLPRYPEYEYGQILKIQGKLEKPVVFEDFNYQNYLKGKQIYLVINRPSQVEIIGYKGSVIKKWLYGFSNRFEKGLNRSLPEPEASFAAGLLLGSRRGLPDSLNTAMQNTGTSHLVAISGYNITIILLYLGMLLTFLGRRNKFFLLSLIATGFVILTGASASILRGSIVALLALFAKTIDRRADQTNILLLSALIMLMFNPLMLVYDYGFLLSFAAFSGLVYLSPVIEKGFDRQKSIQKIPPIILNPFRETLSAQIMTLPLLVFAFGKISLVSPITNVLILPLVPIVMLASLVTGVFAIISIKLGILFGYLSWPLLHYPLFIIELFNSFNLSAIDFGKNFLWFLFLGYGLIIFWLFIWFKRSKDASIHQNRF